MPAIVDHDRRRKELAEVAAGLVATGGADAATVRAVARSAGFSTKVVSHYFDDKRSLLLATYQFAAARATAITQATQRPGHADVAVFVKALLPIERAQRENWLVWYAFWAHAITDAEFAREQQAQVTDTRRQIERRMRADSRFRHLQPTAIRRGARDLLTEIIGVALQAVFDDTYWTPTRQRNAVDARLKLLLE
jgi:AcrR family transcriptional regulator